VHSQCALYFEAVAFFRTAVSLIHADQWENPSLGVWSVRDLVGHTSRALANVQRDIIRPLPSPGDYETAMEYFQNATMPGLAEGVAERGRQSGAALGANPLQVIDESSEAVRALLAEMPDDARIATPFGRLPLAAYMDTKIFELVVHTLDISAAADITLEPPAGPLAATLRVTLQLAARRETPGDAAALLRALTGRAPLPAGYSVI
jgi:uncharacterized protein (TIGR03083 family)